MKERFSQFFDNNYKKILILPAILIVVCLAYLFFFYSQNGDVIYKDVSLTGGTTISVLTSIPSSELLLKISKDFPDVSVSSVSDNTGNQIKLIITAPQEPDQIKPKLESALGFSLTDDNSSIEFTGSSLSQDFYTQLLRAIVFAFLLMALVVFLVFGREKIVKVYSIILTILCAKLTFPTSSFLNLIEVIAAIFLFIYSIYLTKTKKPEIYYTLAILIGFILIFIFPVYYFIFLLAIILFSVYSFFSVPSLAVIFSAFADVIMPLAVIDMMGMKISSAGIVAFLMLIGYSVDTDILLTTRVLKRKGDSVNQAIWGAFKTGMTMTLTSLIAVSIGLIIVFSFGSILNQIFTILIIGLAFDILNTWITNVCLIKWYVERRRI